MGSPLALWGQMESHRLQKSLPTAKSSLIKMTGAVIVLLAISILSIRRIDPRLRIVLVAFGVLAVLPVVVLFGADAGKAIKREAAPTAAMRRLAVGLIFPQPLFGYLLVCAGIVIPFINVRAISLGAADGHFAGMSVMCLVISLMLPSVGLRLVTDARGRTYKGIPWSALPLPLWVKVAMLANTIAVATSVIAFFTIVGAEGGEHAAWIWRPLVSISLYLAGIPLSVHLIMRGVRQADVAN